MNLNYIRNKIFLLLNQRYSFIYKGNRNQTERFVGFIEKCYSRIFVIRVLDDSIKTFSYSDIIIGNLEILPYNP
ncbi:MAG: hypothetical protein IJ463_08750 [Bacilli bacterium]|nr:hypothetical protein [Bacilli bacterium]